MLFKDITIIDENFSVQEHYCVGTRGRHIAYVSDRLPEENFGEVYEGKNRLLLPSFYNMHSHLPMALMRGYGENLPLSTWLNERIFPFEAKLTDEDMYYGTLMGIAEMLRYGIGATSEMYLSYEPLCRAFLESGVKANISRCCTCFEDVDFTDLPLYKEALSAIKNYDGADDGRLHVEFSLHSEYLNPERVARGIADAARKHNSSMHIHLAETRSETEQCRERHQGRSPVRFLADCGIFDTPTVAAHCVHVDDEDIAILKEKNVTVATNPKSNAKLSSGICPVTKFIRAGVNLAIGTDSVASNNNLNMIEEIRFMNLMQKSVTFDPTVITPTETLRAATYAGAVGQRRTDCGLIKEGFRADITVMDTDKVYMKPVHDLLNNLIYSSSGNDVVMTMVDGRVLYRNGEYTSLDIERIEFECEKARKRILSSF